MYQSLIASLLVLSTAARAQEVVTVCRATDLAAPSGSVWTMEILDRMLMVKRIDL